MFEAAGLFHPPASRERTAEDTGDSKPYGVKGPTCPITLLVFVSVKRYPASAKGATSGKPMHMKSNRVAD